MSKELDELRREYAENEAKLQQYQHRVKRLEQRRQYYEKGERQKRAHRLITRGAASERQLYESDPDLYPPTDVEPGQQENTLYRP